MLTDSDRPPADTLGGKSNDLCALAAAASRKVCSCAVFGSLCCMTFIIDLSAIIRIASPPLKISACPYLPQSVAGPISPQQLFLAGKRILGL